VYIKALNSLNSKEYELTSVSNFERHDSSYVRDISKSNLGSQEDSTTVTLKSKSTIKIDYSFFLPSKAVVEIIKIEPRSITFQANVAKKSSPDNVYVLLKQGPVVQYSFTNYTQEDDEYTFSLQPDEYYHRYGGYEVYVVVND